MKHLEARLQKVIVSHLMMSGAMFFSIPNEGRRSAIMGAHLKAMGMYPGIADLCVIVDGKAHFMEVKAAEKGVLSQSQINFARHCSQEQIPYEVVRDIGSALKVLASWGAVRPARVAA